MSNSEQVVHLVELKGVAKSYATAGSPFAALHPLDLQVSRGEFLAVVRKSGSGKSTLLNLIAGIDRPTAGELMVCGAAVHQLDESRLATWRGLHVGVVFQFFQLLPTLSVLENVMLPMDFCATLPTAKARLRAMELLGLVGVADQANKLPLTLSGGQQQRAAIARALANNPPLILADEPTGNLDSQTAEDVLTLLSSIAGSGRSVIMVTHERELSSIADRIITLADGRLASDQRLAKGAPRA